MRSNGIRQRTRSAKYPKTPTRTEGIQRQDIPSLTRCLGAGADEYFASRLRPKTDAQRLAFINKIYGIEAGPPI